MFQGKHILWGAGVLSAFFGVRYLMSLGQLSRELETSVSASVHKVSLTGISLRINVQLKNPSRGAVVVKHPFIKLVYGDKTIATSEVQNTDVKLDKFSEKSLGPIVMNLGFLSLASTAPQLLKDYRINGKLTLLVRVVTTINGSIPYAKDEHITLGSGQAA